jgi:hypothetical protein
MQDFDVESKTSGISSSSTLWQDLEAPYKSCNEANSTPRSLGTKPEKMTNFEELRPTRRETDDNGPHPEGEGSRRLKNQRHMKEAGKWAWMGPGRSAQAGRPSPVHGPFVSPFDLAAIRAIYSPGVKSHESINLSSAAEEQRREGHHSGEERVELVD